jgi:protein SCO1
MTGATPPQTPAPTRVELMGGRRPSWIGNRWPWVALALVLAAALAAVGTWGRSLLPGRPHFAGAVFQPPAPAYDFRLPDQDGRIVSLSSLRGKAVALTFLYTHCPDVCPLIAEALHRTYQHLGDIRGRVALIAVSVDPNGDTPAAVRDFLVGHHVAGELTYLTGSFDQLRPVWAHYYVGSDAQQVTPEAATAARPSPDQVGHTAIVYVIDPKGRIVAFLPGNFDPQDLVTDLRLLAPRATGRKSPP